MYIHYKTENYERNVNDERLKVFESINWDERYQTVAGCEAWVDHIVESYLATNNDAIIEDVKNNLIGQKHLEGFKRDLDDLFELIQVDTTRTSFNLPEISEKKRSVRDRLLEYFLNNGIN